MYQVLARKYRPRNFYELVGQQHVSKALTSALERGRLHHAYLFTGTRGVGKTTIARILAKCLNCETGITATPCEQCNVCQAVNEGRFIDLIEIDAASRTKVEDTRELLDNVPYAPTQGRFKVYLIDEVHMLSTHSFNALLKTLEEPPEHVKFLFATTDPQKLPITVVSRCLQFTLRPLTVEEIHHHVEKILDLEQIQRDDSAIWQLAESAQGSLRDALSLTDQAIAYGQGAIHQHDVKEMLGLIDKHLVYDLLLAIHQNKRQWVAELLLLFRQQAIDVAMVLDQLISTLHELALMQYLPNMVLNYSEEINHKIQQLAQNISAQDLQLYYQIACKGRDELNLAVTQEQGFEMCILRLLAFRPLAIHEMVVPPQGTLEYQTKSENSEQNQYYSLNNLEQNTHNEQPSLGVEEQDYEPIASVADDELASSKEVELEKVTITLDDLRENYVIFNHDDLIDVLQGSLKVAEQTIVKGQGLLAFDGSQDVLDLQDSTQVEHLFASNVVQDNRVNLINEVDVTDSQGEDVFDTVIEHSSVQSIQEPVNQNLSSDNMTPQQILQIPTQDLTGQWTAEKWEYWLRTSDLSPVVQGFLQDAIMVGNIETNSVLQIAQHYKTIFQRFLTVVEQELKKLNPNHHLKVEWVEQLDAQIMTPLRLQQQRNMQAHQRAIEMLHQHQGIQYFLQTFSGQLKDVQIGEPS